MILSVLLLLLLCTSGCRDRYNVDELAIVIGVGIDRVAGAEPILLTVQVVNAGMIKSPGGEGGGGGGEGKPFITLSSQGKSFLDAVRNLAKSSPRKLFFSHNKVIVLGKTFAESDISEVMDYVQRDREFRRTNLILMAEQTAKEVLVAKMDIERLPALGLQLWLNSKDQTFIYPINLNDFLLNLKNDVGVSYAPLVSLKDTDQESKSKLEEITGKPMESSDKKHHPQVYLQEMAVFKNNHLVGTLNENESKDLLWLTNKLKGDTITVHYQTTEGEGQAALAIVNGSSKIIPHITDRGISIEIVCTGEAVLSEISSISDQLKDLQIYTEIKQNAEKILKTRLEHTIDKAQKELKVDFLGFGNKIHNYNPTEWHAIKNEWDQRFPEVQYNVTVQLTIRQAGIIRGSAIAKENGE